MGYTCILCKKPSYKKFKNQAAFHSWVLWLILLKCLGTINLISRILKLCVRFPKCPIQKKVWMNICNVTDQVNLEYRKICSFHFEPECYEKNKKKRLLKPDAIPTIFVKRFMKKEHYYYGILEGIIHFCSSSYYLLMLNAINSVLIPWIWTIIFALISII